VKRREFIAGLGGAVAWPVMARAQQSDRMRHIGVLANLPADDAQMQTRNGAFLEALQRLGWSPGRNVEIEYRWGGEVADRNREYAAELVALAPDVIVCAGGSPGLAALQRATRTVPIVFANIIDPVGQGFVEGLARPGGNITGFTIFEYGLSVKWLEVLKKIVPGMSQVAVARDATTAIGNGQWGAIQSVAPSFGVELRPVDTHEANALERAVAAFARAGKNGGLIVTPSGLAAYHRELIISLAARHRLPAVYPFRFFVTGGGLISYGPDLIEPLQRAAGYVDRILKGEKPADLPVQATTKYELAINLTTAKTLGLTIPETLLATADEVIQ
jgi:putative tryptophan/tyrosine transport system substrate-binding protein